MSYASWSSLSTMTSSTGAHEQSGGSQQQRRGKKNRPCTMKTMNTMDTTGIIITATQRKRLGSTAQYSDSDFHSCFDMIFILLL